MASIFSVKCEVRMVPRGVGRSYINGLKRTNVLSFVIQGLAGNHSRIDPCIEGLWNSVFVILK